MTKTEKAKIIREMLGVRENLHQQWDKFAGFFNSIDGLMNSPLWESIVSAESLLIKQTELLVGDSRNETEYPRSNIDWFICWVSEDNIPEKSYPLFRAWGIMEQLVTDLQQGQKR